jgi:hypothetical protein
MWAVGRVADAEWGRAIRARCPSPNPRNEVHYDEDFHYSASIATARHFPAEHHPALVMINSDLERFKVERQTGKTEASTAWKVVLGGM